MKTVDYSKNYYELYFTEWRYVPLGILCLPIFMFVIFTGIVDDIAEFLSDIIDNIIRG